MDHRRFSPEPGKDADLLACRGTTFRIFAL
jgi:hypothetical protein